MKFTKESMEAAMKQQGMALFALSSPFHCSAHFLVLITTHSSADCTVFGAFGLFRG